MTEMLILSRFSAFAGFGLPCDFRETITIPATANDVRRFYSARLALAGRHAPLSGFPVRRGFADPSQVLGNTGSAAGALSSGSPKPRPGGGAMTAGFVAKALPPSHAKTPRRASRSVVVSSKIGIGKIKGAGHQMHRLRERGRRRTRQDQISPWA
jgi:hypothetical protein